MGAQKAKKMKKGIIGIAFVVFLTLIIGILTIVIGNSIYGFMALCVNHQVSLSYKECAEYGIYRGIWMSKNRMFSGSDPTVSPVNMTLPSPIGLVNGWVRSMVFLKIEVTKAPDAALGVNIYTITSEVYAPAAKLVARAHATTFQNDYVISWDWN